MPKPHPCRAWLIALALVAPLPGVAQEDTAPDGDPLDHVPAASLLTVVLNSPETHLATLDQYLLGLAPQPVAALVRQQLGGVLGSPNLDGVDLAGNLAAFMPLPGVDDPTSVGLLLPIDDYEQLLAGSRLLNQAGVDDVAILNATVAAVPFNDAFALLAPVPFYDQLQAVKGRLQALAAADTLGARLDAAEGQRAEALPLWAYGDVQRAVTQFGPLIDERRQALKEALEAQATQGGMGGMGVFADSYLALFDLVLAESSALSLGFDFSPQVVTLSLALTARPDTTMASFFQGRGEHDNRRLLPYLGDRAIMGMVFNASPALWQRFNAFYFAILDQLPEVEPQAVADFKAVLGEMADILGNGVAVDLGVTGVGPVPFSSHYLVELRDPAGFEALFERFETLLESDAVSALYGAMGMPMGVKYTVERGIRQYRGIAIDAVTTAFETTDPATPLPPELPEGGLTTELAVVDDLLLYSFGVPMEGLIDAVEAEDNAIAPQYLAALEVFPEAASADLVMTYNVAGIAQAMAQQQVAGRSSLVITGDAEDGHLTTQIALPKQHLLESVMAFMALQQQQQP
ncbi:MAG: hypothetical protein ACFCBW_15090 [Candidatus Competibacterales bacterium]